MILPFCHDFLFLLSMIRIADEVENTMNHDPMQFPFQILPEFGCIFLHPVDADKNIAGNSIGLVLIWESENIGKRFVLQVSFVQLK